MTPDGHCFRMDEQYVEELRERFDDDELINACAHWVKHHSARIDEVISELTSAFAELQLGAGIGLKEARGLDNYASGAELKRLRALDERSDWRRITSKDLNLYHDAVAFFDAEGFVFHLPAFLIAELNDRLPSGIGFIYRLIQCDEHPQGWKNLLSMEQKQAIVGALKLIGEHPFFDRNDVGPAIESLSQSN